MWLSVFACSGSAALAPAIQAAVCPRCSHLWVSQRNNLTPSSCLQFSIVHRGCWRFWDVVLIKCKHCSYNRLLWRVNIVLENIIIIMWEACYLWSLVATQECYTYSMSMQRSIKSLQWDFSMDVEREPLSDFILHVHCNSSVPPQMATQAAWQQ